MNRPVSPRLRRTGAVLALALAALWPLASTSAIGPVWLPMVQATHTTFNHLFPAMATYRNHAYILSTRANPTTGATLGVYFTTNESGTWTTQLLSSHGPFELLEDYQTALTVDPPTKRLYAVWAYPTKPGQEALGVWTRDAAGAWSGPTTIATSSQFTGPPSVVADHGKVYVAFTAEMSGPCDDSKLLRTDVLIVSYDGSTWSQPRNLTSCVTGLPAGWGFWTPKLALDTGGHLYLVSANYTQLKWDLWYMDDAGGAWSSPVQITHGRDDDKYHYSYAIAASQGTAYVAYTASLRPFHIGYHEIFVAMHPHGGAWTTSRVTRDSQNCDKRSVALVARAGRLGLAYIQDGTACGGLGVIYNVPQLLTGTPGHWTEAHLSLAPHSTCDSPALSSDGDIFRFAVGCHVGVEGNDDLFYKPEFLDVVGPTILHFAVPATATAPAVTLQWSAQDPTPGSGVAYYELQVREDGGSWQVVAPATHATTFTYGHLRAGHHYTFRVRARDGVHNWGAWATGSTQAA